MRPATDNEGFGSDTSGTSSYHLTQKQRRILAGLRVSRTNLHPNTRVRYAVSRRAPESFFGSARRPDLTDAAVEACKTARVERGTGPSGVNRDLTRR
jgi:hypothetical protein